MSVKARSVGRDGRPTAATRTLAYAVGLAFAVIAVVSSPAAAINFGSNDVNTPVANAVVWVDGCTGTLITPDTVLTAGHCLSPADRGDDLPHHEPAVPACAPDWQAPGRWYPVRTTVTVGFGNNRTAFVQTRLATQYALPVCADMAMLRLSAPVSSSVAVPLPVLGNFGDDVGGRDAGKFAGQRFEFAGWGRDETGTTPTVRQYATGRYETSDDLKMWVRGDGGALLNFGDSGGPLLWRSPSGVRYVVGVAQGWDAFNRYTATFRTSVDGKPSVANFFAVAKPDALYCPDARSRPAGTLPLMSWYGSSRNDNMGSTAPSFAGCYSAVRSPGYTFTNTDGAVFDPALPRPAGTVPLYRWYSPSRGDNWTTAQHGDIGATGGDLSPDYRFARLEGYVFDPTLSRPAGTVPLYSWSSPSRGDNWTTTQHGDIGAAGGVLSPDYHVVRLEGYVFAL